MKNVGRNDPCPCGSGKKFKKCHGATNVVEINPDRYNHELDKLHQGLIDFSLNHYEVEMQDFIHQHPQPNIIEKQYLVDSFFSGLTSWFILNQFLQNGQTIVEKFYESQHKKIKYSSVKNAISEWKNAIHSIFKIIEVANDNYYIQDIRTNKTYHLRRHEEQTLEIGNISVGILLPYVSYHEFLLNEIEIYKEDYLYQKGISSLNDQEFRERFPELLADILNNEVDEPVMEWGHPTYKAVAEIFTSHFLRKVKIEDFIETGISVWNDFIERVAPIVRKPEAYAAALDCVIQYGFFEEEFQTQKEIANEYGVSVNTVSRNANRIFEVLDEIIADDYLEDLPIEPSLDVEKNLDELQRHLNEMEFESEEELHDYIDGLLNKSVNILTELNSPREVAQEMLFKAYEAEGARREELIKEALKIYPNSPDAYLLMALDAVTQFEEYQLLHQAVLVGEKDLGKTFFKENKGHFWMIPETRAYMRAKEAIAYHLYNYSDKYEAIEHFEDLLELNPNDNQGIRYELLTIYLEIGDIEAANELHKVYENDASINFVYNRVLISYLQEGLSAKTKIYLKQAINKYPLVKDYLIGKRQVRRKTRERMELDEDAAYASRHYLLWSENELLFDELKKR